MNTMLRKKYIIRIYLSICVLLIVISSSYAQSNIPVATTIVPATTTSPVTPPASYIINNGIFGLMSPEINSVKTWQPKKPFSAAADVVSDGQVQDVNSSSQYFDALGRPIQTVDWQASPLQTDMVATVAYDSYGREQYQYLPYTSSGTTGAFRADPFNEQKTFYSSTYVADQPAMSGEHFYYSHADFEASPLNRITKSFAPGNSWAGSEGTTNEHATQVQYLINNVNDAVRIWNINDDPLTYSNSDVSTNIPVTSGVYASYNDPNANTGYSTLKKTVTLDEQKHATVEYTDEDGQLVLKKVQVGNTVPADYSGQDANWLCTYYVYDDFGRLRFVIPPKVTAWLTANNWSFTAVGGAQIINELCFRYEYDNHDRTIAKKMPGQGWIYMIYDIRDRQIFKQDANMRAQNQWSYVLYDVIDRPIQSGVMQDNTTPAALQLYENGLTYVAATTTTVNGTTTTATAPPILNVPPATSSRTLYEASGEVDVNGVVAADPTSLNVPYILMDIAQPNNITSSQQVNANPIPAGITTIPLIVNYYDDYSWTNKTYDYSYNDQNGKLDKGTNVYADPLPTQQVNMTIGAATGMRVRAIENANDLTQGNWMETAVFYDEKGRPVQSQSLNYKGGIDEAIQIYSFKDQIVCTYQVDNNPSSSVNNFRVKTNINYDNGGRVLNIIKEINDDPATLRTIVQNTYDALGRLKNKSIGQKKNTDGSLSASALENEIYAYNIRGELKGINWDYSNNVSGSKPLASVAQTPTCTTCNSTWFAMDLSYDGGFTNNQYNGNIAGQRWETAGDGTERSFGYGYDNTNRLLYADFNQNNGGTWNKNISTTANGGTIDFSLKMGDGINYSTAYDENGNIKQLQQNGLLLNTSQAIDNLTYNYNANSNKLSSVSDAITANNNLGDFVDNNTGSDDYGYDQNGNLITDKNKYLNGATGIDQLNGGAITYNYMNLPYLINAQNKNNTAKGTIIYIYDALGNKLEKRVNELASASNNNTAIQTTTTYLGGFVYQNNVLQFLGHEEGRIRAKQVVVNGQTTTQYVYDYFIKDNLGDIRSVLTDEQKTDIYPVATLETGATATEANYYTINTNDIINNPSSLSGPSPAPDQTYLNSSSPFANPNTTSVPGNKSQKMYRLNGSTGDKTGLGITLRVMAGDNVNISGKSYWNNAGGPTINNNNLITSVLSNFITSFAGTGAVTAAVHGGVTSTMLNASQPTNAGLLSWLNGVPSPANAPKAYINWILFDEHFVPVASSSNFDPVSSTSGQLKTHQDIVNIAKNGYLYVYCSNESNIDVFFDNLQVVQTHGPLVQENTYSPFGLQLQGISSNAVCYGDALTQKDKFNGGNELQSQEFSDGTGLGLYDATYRMYDQQLGRFNQIDLLSDLFYSSSPYVYALDNPVFLNDPLGLDAGDGGGDDGGGGGYGGSDGSYGGGSGYSQTTQDIVNTLMQYQYGGTWVNGPNGGTYTSFNNSTEAFDEGAVYATQYNLWGQNGVASSYTSAQNAYYKLGGTDPAVGSKDLPVSQTEAPIIVHGGFSNGTWYTTSIDWSQVQGDLYHSDIEDDVNKTGTILGISGVLISGSGALQAGKIGEDAYWLGKNGKYYSQAWGGNGATGGRNAVVESAEIADRIAKPLGILAIGVSVVQVGFDLHRGDYKEASIHSLDAVMGAVGTFGGPVGIAVSGVYFVSRFFWGD